MTSAADHAHARRHDIRDRGGALAALPLVLLLLACEAQPRLNERDQGAHLELGDGETAAPSNSSMNSVEGVSEPFPLKSDIRDTVFHLDTIVWADADALVGRRRWLGAVVGRWTHVGSLEDESLLTPATLAVTAEAVLVGDWGAGQIIAFDRYSPRVLWRVGREGSGPGGFRQPWLWADSDSSVLVTDFVTRRLDVLGARGSLRSVRSLASFGSVSGICRRSDGALWLKARPSGETAFDGIGVLREKSDSLGSKRSLPFESPVHESGMGGAATLVRTGDGDCLVAPSYFSWIGVINEETGDIVKRALVESVPAPSVVVEPTGPRSRRITLSDETVAITRHLTVSRDRAFVIAKGRSVARGRIVDVYQLDPWRYEGTLAFPEQINAISLADSTLAVISEDPTGYLRVIVTTIRPLRQ